MKKTYRNGEYTMEISPNGNLWLVRKGKKCVATLDVEWIAYAPTERKISPLALLWCFLGGTIHSRRRSVHLAAAVNATVCNADRRVARRQSTHGLCSSLRSILSGPCPHNG